MPATFKDSQDKEWTIRLDAPLVKKIEETTGIRLTDLKANPFGPISDDPVLLWDVLWLCCEKDATKESISSNDFGERLGGRETEAVQALLQAVIEMFPASRREHLKAIQEKNQENESLAYSRALTKLDSGKSDVEQAVDKRVDSEFKKMLKSLSDVT